MASRRFQPTMTRSIGVLLLCFSFTLHSPTLASRTILEETTQETSTPQTPEVKIAETSPSTSPVANAAEMLGQKSSNNTNPAASFPNKITRIVAIGDSITAGSRKTGNYRVPLKNLLDKAGKKVEFVGGSCDSCWAAKSKGQAVGHWCKVSCHSADDKYLGFWMWSARNILKGDGPRKARTDGGGNSGISDWVNDLNFDVATIHLGTNGLTTTHVQEHVRYIAEIVRILQAKNPNVKVFVAKIIPWNEKDVKIENRLKEFNDALDKLVNGASPNSDQSKGDKASGLSTKTSPVKIVDCSTGFQKEKFMADGLHPNLAGAEFMAKRFFEKIVQDI